ncbi:CRISPR-associated protein Csx16 [Zoogloea sp.]|uniref:CRISPR-associated protein Csx16 n=1 Tax=Zoogloea sp. TaxID=49181 RepID=UPI0035B3BEEA
MSTWFVTRHSGAVEWARRHHILADVAVVGPERIVESLSPEQVQPGDVVIGTLPVHLAAQVCARGGRYLHLTMAIPLERRGQELNADDMEAFGAECREFILFGSSPQGSGAAPEGIADVARGEGIHICLVSDQHLANLLPVLKRRPARVELVCTPEMQQSGRGLDRLARGLQRFGYGPEGIGVHPAPAEASTDFLAARRLARTLRERLLADYPGVHLTLNATGGTKALSSAFLLEFQGFEIIYTDTASLPGYIRHMEQQPWPPEPLGSLIPTLEDYFHCQGFVLSRSSSDEQAWRAGAEARRGLSNRLVKAMNGGNKSIGGMIGALNKKAHEVEQKLLRQYGPAGKKLKARERDALLETHLPNSPQDFELDFSQGLEDLETVLLDYGVLQHEHGRHYRFPSLDVLRYLSGGWIEEWAWLIARECGADDCRAGVFIRAESEKHDNGHDDNELDLVILHNNRLLIAECKTINWRGDNAKQEIFNKLDALSNHARGLFGKSLLLSARGLDDDAKRRAQAYGISVLAGWGLPKLKSDIQRWMGVANKV